MKEFNITLLLLFLAIICHGQSGLAIINDTDGYVNVRVDSPTGSKVISKLFDGEVFFCDVFDADTGKWRGIMYEPEVGGLDKEQKAFYSKFIHWDSAAKESSCLVDGYIYRSEFTLLHDLPHIRTNLPDTSEKPYIVIKNDSLVFEAKETRFNSSKHKIHLDDTVYMTFNGQRRVDHLIGVNEIDGRIGWGVFDEIPEWQLTLLKLSINGKAVNIPDSAYNDMFDFHPHLSYCRVVFGKKGYLYITMSGSDGAASYAVAWVFKNGKYINRYIDTTLD